LGWYQLGNLVNLPVGLVPAWQAVKPSCQAVQRAGKSTFIYHIWHLWVSALTTAAMEAGWTADMFSTPGPQSSNYTTGSVCKKMQIKTRLQGIMDFWTFSRHASAEKNICKLKDGAHVD
jgi:hypothetical protein